MHGVWVFLYEVFFFTRFNAICTTGFKHLLLRRKETEIMTLPVDAERKFHMDNNTVLAEA